MGSRVVSFGGQWQLSHTEMGQAENGSADMCGSMPSVEEPDLRFSLSISQGAECEFLSGNNVSQIRRCLCQGWSVLALRAWLHGW